MCSTNNTNERLLVTLYSPLATTTTSTTTASVITVIDSLVIVHTSTTKISFTSVCEEARCCLFLGFLAAHREK
jgi:hypothetical protein